MNSDPGIRNQETRLLDFAARFLRENGALIEQGSRGINALLPKDLAGRLGTGEYITLEMPWDRDQDSVAGASGHPGPGGEVFSIHFGAPLLDRILGILTENPPLLHTELHFSYLKSGGFDNLVQEQFEWHKATGSVTSFGQIHTRYLLLNCKYLAQSDEQKEGRFDLAVNSDSGALVPGMTADFTGIDKEFRKTGTIDSSENMQTRLNRLVQTYGKAAVDQETDAFKNSMNRRFTRDAKSLDAYYHALAQEMDASLERANVSEALKADRKEKIAMIPEELAAKKKDLLNKYRIRITLYLAGAMMVRTPAVKLLFTASVGRNRKTLSLIYNPVTKRIDPLVCESCHQSMYQVAFGNDLCTLCLECHGKIR
ncbi:MAG: hypothetical protein R6V15_14100 [Desulfotignum sp.]